MDPTKMHFKRVTLTSKKNWWMVELDEDGHQMSSSPAPQQQDGHLQDWPNELTSSPKMNDTRPLLEHRDYSGSSQTQRTSFPQRTTTQTYRTSLTPHASTAVTSIFHPPSHPSSLFSFPTPTTYSAPPHPTQNLLPFATGSASELFKCVVKKPDIVQLEINGEMQGNARDVSVQFLAELRVYTTLTRHRNICAFLGALENVGMVLEYVEGRTLWDVIKDSTSPDTKTPLTRTKKIDFHNQLLDGLTHLHSFGLSHGDLSLLNIQVTWSRDTIKLLDFGRSVSADSVFASPDDDLQSPPYAGSPTLSPQFTPRGLPITSRFGQQLPSVPAFPPPPYAALQPTHNGRRIEQIHPGTRPFSAPEVLRGECADPLLADAYSFGMVLACLDLQRHVDVPPWEQRKDRLPKGLLESLGIFKAPCERYLRRVDERCRVLKEDSIDPNLVEDVVMEDRA
ncbi:kinase-like protein [Phanerochaete sordida]|uniref:Kinase-like protein n=1 Tax=Phanerochaete sordida TaxID=48140 RepID=A0A9P3GGC5_9APHY|nr:kinase-like protein [Phanerochaete sordida]